MSLAHAGRSRRNRPSCATPALGELSKLEIKRLPTRADGVFTRSALLEQPLLFDARVAALELHFPLLDINGYYSFISTAMIALFIIGLVIIFVYEYEALRRSKPSRGP